MKKITKKDIENFAKEIMAFLENNGLDHDVSIYYNNNRMRKQSNWNGNTLTYKLVIENRMDPHKYFKYAAYDHILSMSFEGTLYDVLNYSGGKMEEQFCQLFYRHGLYYEIGNAWNLTAVPNDDNMEIEYTHYKKPNETIHLYYYNKDNYPTEIEKIMRTWFMLSTEVGDRGSCVLGAGICFEYKGNKYFMQACSPYQGSLSWEKNVKLIESLLIEIGADNVHYDCGRMD